MKKKNTAGKQTNMGKAAAPSKTNTGKSTGVKKTETQRPDVLAAPIVTNPYPNGLS